MSTPASTEFQEGSRMPRDWRPRAEAAPSQMRADEPVLPRMVALAGIVLILWGSLGLLLTATGRTNVLVFGTFWSTLFIYVGLGAILFHAVSDREFQVRRLYTGVGLLAVAAAVVLFLMMAANTTVSKNILFGVALLGLVVGLLFLMASVRQETDEPVGRAIVQGIGGVGALLILTAVIGGNIGQGAFLYPFGLLLFAAGYFYLWGFLALETTASELGYKTALGLGLVGVVVFLI